MFLHRIESPTQTVDDARRQEASGEMWGRYPSLGFTPMVEMYRGPLPAGKRGVEFTTDVSPDPGGVPSRPRWSGPRPGVDVDDAFAKIGVTVTKNTQT